MGLETLLVTLLAIMPAPQQQAQTQQSQPRDRHILEGTVHDTAGEPVVGALVLVASDAMASQEPLRTETDERGGFRLALKGPDHVSVRIEAEGLAPKLVERVKPGEPLDVRLQQARSITGVVLEGSSGAPLPDVVVEAWDRSQARFATAWDTDAGTQTRTDSEGRFELAGLAPGVHSVYAKATGCGRTQRKVPAGGKVELYLFPGGGVSGVVYDEHDDPVAGAKVTAEPEMPQPEARTLRPVSTDEWGRFELFGLEPGSYRVAAQHAEMAPGWANGVEVHVDADAFVDIELAPPVRVTGRLIDSADRPLAGTVSLHESQAEPVPRMVSELLRTQATDDGGFLIEAIPPGEHVLAASSPGFETKRLEISVRYDDAEVDVGDVVLETGLTMRGWVRDRQGLPIGGAQIEGFARSGMGEGEAEARSRADGSFVLAGLQPGEYWFLVSAVGYARVSRRAAAGDENVEVVLEKGGAITGVVVDGSGNTVESYQVTARAPRRDRMSLRPLGAELVGDPQGRFTLQDLAEGKYVLQVRAPDLAAATVSDVAVEAGLTTDVGRIRLGRGGTVQGSVVTTTDAPIPGATVSLQPPGRSDPGVDRSATLQDISDGSGLFDVRGVAAGNYDVVARHPAYAEGRVAGLRVEPEFETPEVRIAMSPGGRVEGWVRRRDGSGAIGIPIQILPTPSGQRPSYSPYGMVLTDEEGHYAVDRVAPGPARVMLFAGSPQHLQVAQALPVEILDGGLARADFVLRDILLSGVVTRSGAPVPRANMSIWNDQAAGYSVSLSVPLGATPQIQRMQAITRADGGFEMLVDGPGRHGITVEAVVEGRVVRLMRWVEIPDADSHWLELDFAGATLTGTVVDRDTDQPIPLADVMAFGRTPDGQSSNAMVTTGPDGRFQFDVEPGRYRVRAQGKGYARQMLTVEVGSSGLSDLRLELSAGLSLNGFVVDDSGRGVEGVRLLALGSDPGQVGSARSLADGSFSIPGLAPIAHSVLGSSDTGSFAFAPSALPGDEKLTVLMRPGGRLTLVVRDAAGLPLERANASLNTLDGVRVGGVGSYTESGPDGILELMVPAGNVGLLVFRDELTAEPEVSITAGSLGQLEVILTETAE